MILLGAKSSVDVKRSALAQARHPNAPVCPGCKRPIVPGTRYPAGRKPRHFGC